MLVLKRDEASMHALIHARRISTSRPVHDFMIITSHSAEATEEESQ